MLGRLPDVPGPLTARSSRRSIRRPSIRRLPFLLLLVPVLVGLIGIPSAKPVRGDELSDAIARQKSLERLIASQKASIAKLNALQSDLSGQISDTRSQLAGIDANLTAVRTKINGMVKEIDQVKEQYAALVTDVAVLDAQLLQIQMQEDAKRVELKQRMDLLADRIRTAYETDRTSPLALFLGGASFTDVLAEVSYNMDVAEQDKALAEQISKDRETLAALHQSVDDTRAATDEMRAAAADQKVQLDAKLAALQDAQAHLKALEQAAAASLAAQRAAYQRLAANKTALARSVAAAAASRAALAKRIDRLIAAQASQGRIPSAYNGTLQWPMPGTVTQNFGCTGFWWEPPYGSCAHFHQGIDIVAPYGTTVRASGAGRIAYIGWNYADGADPAWIVIIAHSAGLETWYAHLQPKRVVSAGQWVSAGQVIGYEGNTGHSTGAHLHWAVRQNGTFVNPRLFL